MLDQEEEPLRGMEEYQNRQKIFEEMLDIQKLLFFKIQKLGV